MQVKKPLVAVIGRPNVGKSTFFNKVCGKRISIVKNEPGVTRDRIYADTEWCGKVFTLVDTGGIVFDNDKMIANIRRQAEAAIELADKIIFFVDGKEGITPGDREIAEYLRRGNKSIVLAVNKLDNFEVELSYEFYELNLGEPIPISCEQSKGLGDLLDIVIADFELSDDKQDAALKIAVVGKPNVGKSSLINRILGFDRVIVSDQAGTTRDAIDTPFTHDGNEYIFIDTAGLRRKRGVDYDTIESYANLRSISAIKRADVVLVLFDASMPISEQDVRIAGMVHEEGKPSIIVMNKWDLVEKDSYTVLGYEDKLKEHLAFMSYFQSVFISAESGQRVDKLFSMIQKGYGNASRRISTGTLNDVIRDAVAMSEPPAFSGRRLKIMYATQPETNPPKFVIFINDESLIHFSYRRYLENSLRRAFDFSGTPIKLAFVGRNEDK